MIHQKGKVALYLKILQSPKHPLSHLHSSIYSILINSNGKNDII